MPDAIGFPAPLLGEKSIRVPVLASGPGFAALLKPPGVAWDDHPWNAGAPNILAAWRAQLAEGKPELLALGISRPASVHHIEPEVGGVALVADRDTDALDRWRNAFGSGLIVFTFRMLALAADAPEEGGECDLPMAAHRSESRALVSRTTGKKSLTTFRVVERLGRWTLWEAATTLPRPHQVRLHASEAGIRIVGETVYGKTGDIMLSDLRRRGRLNKGEDRAVNAGLALRLVSADAAALDAGLIAGEDDAWTGALARIRSADAR